MSFDAQTLLGLLPPLYRIRDRALAQTTPGLLPTDQRARLLALGDQQDAGAALTDAEAAELAALQAAAQAGPLASLLAVLAEKLAVLEEDLEQLYDDQFIETCAPWVIPYIGDLIGYQTLHGVAPEVQSPRAEVAHTVGFRRRKGTLAVLEQLAHDVTGWNARAVEQFPLLITTQYMNHPRTGNHAAPDMRQSTVLARLGTAFDATPRTVDVRRIASGRGRHNIRNVALHLWRLDAQSLTASPVVPFGTDGLRFHFHPLGIDQPLYTRPADVAANALVGPLNVPLPIGLRALSDATGDYYGAGSTTGSLELFVQFTPSGPLTPVSSDQILICSLADLKDGSGNWAHTPPHGPLAVDPVLGRIAVGLGALDPSASLKVSFHYGFSAQMGGGEYERFAGTTEAVVPVGVAAPLPVQVPGDFSTIGAALASLAPGAGGIIQINDSGRYAETLAIDVPAGTTIELRAANHCRPTLALGGDLVVTGGANSELRIDGLLVAGHALRAPAAGAAPGAPASQLARLNIRHTTLVPGLSLAPDATPLSPTAASLVSAVPSLAITIDSSIVGGLTVDASSTVTVTGSIVDATSTTGVAFAALDRFGPGGALSLDSCTVIGKVHAAAMPLVTNSILLADLAPNDTWAAPVIAARRQDGCVRFSALPATARVPRRYRCLPESAPSARAAVVRIPSLRYGTPAYAQLSNTSGASVLTGADDEGQPGAFHSLFQPQRETNLRVRFAEYLRAGLEAGIFYES
jgi:hypothetical protein